MKAFVIALAAVLPCLAASSAVACTSGGGSKGVEAAIVLGGSAGAIDLGFTVGDISMGGNPNKAAAVFEILLTAPQAVLGFFIASQMRQANDVGIWLALASWPAALAAHGVWSLAKPEEAADPNMLSRRSSTIRFAPTVVSDGTQLAPALGAVGVF